MSNKQMTASTSVRIRVNDTKVFGPGIAELLERIDRCESIRTATTEMKIAYSKAWTMLRSCEAALGYPSSSARSGGPAAAALCSRQRAGRCWSVTAAGRPTARNTPVPIWRSCSRRPQNDPVAGGAGCGGVPPLRCPQ